jgi:hypothetical protein
MDKNKLIQVLSRVIQDLCDKQEQELFTEQILQRRMIKFRQYPALQLGLTDTIRPVDITIDF